jgi:hypothetical protein
MERFGEATDLAALGDVTPAPVAQPSPATAAIYLVVLLGGAWPAA